MAVKIRLQRRGKKGQAFYHIVIADGRAPRDGRFIEKIGTYNPLTKPADIDLNFDKALDWLQKGAQPTDTARAILSYKGVIYKNHLLKGVKKGALTEEQANAKFDAWLKEKEDKIAKAVNATVLEKKEIIKDRFDAEAKVNESRTAEIAKKRLAEVEGEKTETQEEVVTEETPAAEEKPVAKEVKEETPKTEEVPVAEEAKEETPKAEETKKEEKPAE